MKRKITVSLRTALALCLFASGAAAQQPATQPAPRPADVATVDGIIAALYDVISGPAGQARDWDRMRSIFLPGAHLIATGKTPAGEARHALMTVEDYIRTNGPFLVEGGFFETEIGRTTETFGNVTHAFSTYAARRTLADPEPFMRGINSIQLFNDGSRYWVVNVFWDSERADNPIPAKYIRP